MNLDLGDIYGFEIKMWELLVIRWYLKIIKWDDIL